MNDQHRDEAGLSSSATGHLRALAHPVRLQMLSLLTGTELSAAELARELDLTHANASYHLRVLLKSGEVEIASEERIRGGLARSYRPRLIPETEAQQEADQGAHGLTTSDPQDQARFVRALTERLIARNSQRTKTRAMYVDAELWVSPTIADQVNALLDEASMLLHDHAQRPRTPGTERRNLTVAWFEMRSEQASQEPE